MCDLGTRPCPLNHYCLLFSSHFCRFGQPWNPGFQLRCVSDLSLDLALGVHLLRLLWRERLVPRTCAIHHAVEALRIGENRCDSVGKPWKTAFKDDVKQIETGKSLRTGASRVNTIYSKWPAPKMDEHPQTYSRCVTTLNQRRMRCYPKTGWSYFSHQIGT